MHVEPWFFVCLVSLAGSSGAALATQFEGVALAFDRFVTATAVPAVLALLFSDAGVSMEVAFWTFVLVTCLSCLSVIDAMTRSVPDILSIPMIFLGLLHAYLSGFDTVVFGGFAAAVVMIGLLGQFSSRAQRWIGGGDILLIAGAVAWFGPALLPDLLLVTAAILCLHVAADSFAQPKPATDLPAHPPYDPGVPLAPALGNAQLVIWFGGPLF